jgi:release factor glutamine methyltransferase
MDITDVVANLCAAGCVFAEDEAHILIGEADDDRHLAKMLRARRSGIPLEHVVGWAEFCGRRVAVKPGVFVPRKRSEFLADCAVALIQPRAIVVDLCCGSGALAVAIAASVPGVQVHACDIDPVAVSCATRNLCTYGVRVYRGDLFDALPVQLRGRVDVLVANTPYVPTDEIRLMPPEARDHEPWIALDGGRDGLHFHRRVASEANGWLAPGGCVLIETSREQAPMTLRCFADQGFQVGIDHNPHLGATIVSAIRPRSDSLRQV